MGGEFVMQDQPAALNSSFRQGRPVVLLVEDDENILRTNQRILKREGFEVLCAGTLAGAQAMLVERTPDALVLDITLPDGSGLEFCKRIRPFTSVPMLFLTALDEKSEIIEGLLAGGNDYITKPYDVDEFVARIKAQLRLVRMNRQDVEEKILVRDTLSLNLTAHRAYLEGKDMLLTQKEYALLLLMVRSEGDVLSAEYLYQSVWNLPMTEDNRTLKKHISNVRKKLENGNCGYTITAVYGKGYSFEKT